MIIRFNTLKTVQAAAVLLKLERHRKMSRLRLLKLLYIADRQSIAETLRPITGDDVVAMENGPVLSKTYRLICGEARKDASIRKDGPIWDSHIAKDGKRDHVLMQDPGNDLLSENEVQRLHAVSAFWRGKKDFAIADETHGFAEWVKNQPAEGGREDISLHDILVALGMANMEQSLTEEAEDDEQMADLLSSVASK